MEWLKQEEKLTHLRMEEIKIDIESFRKYAEMLRREETKVKLTPSDASKKMKMKCTVTYQTLNLLTKKIGVVKYTRYVLHNKKGIWTYRGEICK